MIGRNEAEKVINLNRIVDGCFGFYGIGIYGMDGFYGRFSIKIPSEYVIAFILKEKKISIVIVKI